MNATSPYGFDYRSQLFHQHALASDALAKMLRVNGTKIAKLQLSEDIPVPGGKPGTVLTAGTSLETLAQYGVKDPLLAPQTLVLLMEELGKQTRCVFPTIFFGRRFLFIRFDVLDTLCSLPWMTSRHFTASLCIAIRNLSPSAVTTCRCPVSYWSMLPVNDSWFVNSSVSRNIVANRFL